MRPLVLSLFFLAYLGTSVGQTGGNAAPGLPKDPRAVLDAAAPLYDLNSAELKPWHLKATYQFYDPEGKPAEQGTWEYWWASPKVHRSTWTRAGSARTEWSMADGSSFHKESGTQLRYFERNVQSILFSSLPGHGLTGSGTMQLGLQMLPPKKPEFACVSVTWLTDAKPRPSGSAMPDQYCFDPSTMALRVVSSPNFTTLYNQLVKFQGRYLARQVSVMFGNRTLFSVSIDTIESVNPVDAVFTPPTDAISLPHTPTPSTTGPSGVSAGLLLKKTVPLYPPIAKFRHEQGVVVLGAVIGTDGKIENLEVLVAPSPTLAQAAVDAVKTWQYRPYLLNGQPVEVETTINVIFAL